MAVDIQHTRLLVTEAIVTGVRDEVVSMPLADFRSEEVVHMQPGMEAFELGMFGDTCRFGGLDTANAMRAGLLVAHRTLRLSNGNEALPHAVDAQLSAMAGKVAIEPLFEPKHLERNRREVELAYGEDSAVPMLLNDILTKPGSRSGAVLLLGMHISYADPTAHPRFTLAPGPAPATRGRSLSGHRRHAGRR